MRHWLLQMQALSCRYFVALLASDASMQQHPHGAQQAALLLFLVDAAYICQLLLDAQGYKATHV